MDILIKKLNQEYLKTHLVSFINILKNEPYEYWSEENFLIDLPGKFDFSYYLELNEVLASYIISSIKLNKIAYIHKFITCETYRGMGLGNLILEVFELNCRKKEITELQLSVINSNKDAIKFYKKNGFSLLSKKIDSKNNIELLLMVKNI